MTHIGLAKKVRETHEKASDFSMIRDLLIYYADSHNAATDGLATAEACINKGLEEITKILDPDTKYYTRFSIGIYKNNINSEDVIQIALKYLYWVSPTIGGTQKPLTKFPVQFHSTLFQKFMPLQEYHNIPTLEQKTRRVIDLMLGTFLEYAEGIAKRFKRPLFDRDHILSLLESMT